MVKASTASKASGPKGKGKSSAKAQAGAATADGVKKPALKDLTAEERAKKVSRTVGWLNANGGLTDTVWFNDSGLDRVDTRSALKILSEVEEKGSTIRNPTAWIRAAAERIPDRKVRTTIHWYNQNGNLNEEINYDEVKEALAACGTGGALQILSDLEGKTDTIKNPTQWILAAAKRQAGSGGGWVCMPTGGYFGGDGGDDKAVSKMIGWYNNQGNLQQPIQYSECAPLLAMIGKSAALTILNSLEGKEGEVRDPTSWICSAAKKRM